MPDGLDRFKDAQRDEFDPAIAELRAGQKQSHWVWYVFPQLRGLGTSPQAVRFGLDGVGEARAYLVDHVLRRRYREAVAAVHEQVTGEHARLDRLMGSHIDALKLVSSLTLFAHVAEELRREATGESRRDLASIARLADEVLAIAAAQSFRPCAFTKRAIEHARH